MNFNVSGNRSVICWLDALPSDLGASPAQFDCKRRRNRSSERDDSRKRRRHHPLSPLSTMAPPTSFNRSPGKRSIADADETTPRAPRTSDIRDDSLSNALSLTTSSSKRSKRSQSSTKLFPLYGPDGRRLVRDSLNGTTAQSSPACSALLGDMNDVAGRYGILPQRTKAALNKHLEATGQIVERLHDYMFCDDEAWHDDCLDGEGLVRRVVRIAARSADCSRLLSDEAAWNNHVHSPILEVLIHDMQDGPSQNVVEFLSCTTTSIEPAYHRFLDAASRVDYVLHFLPELNDSLQMTYPCFNWTADRLLQQFPLAIGIETKRHDGNTTKGEYQLGVWLAAHWEFLLARVGEEQTEALEILPGVIVQGHSWSLVVTTRHMNTTTVLSSFDFGNTSTVVGVFQVLAGLRRLRKWSLDVLWPWYKLHLLG